MNNIIIEDIIVRADRLFQERYWAWPLPIVEALEGKQVKLAMRWAVCVFKSTIAFRSRRGVVSDQGRWLDDLSMMLDSPESSHLASVRAMEIWNNDSEFNYFERAISRLYSALSAFEMNMEIDYRKTIAKAIVMLAEQDDSDSSWDEEVKQVALSIFAKFASSQ